jgi:hypothetical protein
MLGFDRDRIYEGSQEEKALIRMLETTAEDPILGQLKLPRGITRKVIDDGTIFPIGPDTSGCFIFGRFNAVKFRLPHDAFFIPDWNRKT